MEIKNIKIKGCDVTSIFVGSKYYFYNNYYGFIAIAEMTRDYDNNKTNATIHIGNSHTIGGSMDTYAILPSIKRFINKEENQFVEKKVGYEVVEEDLSNMHISIVEHKWN